MKHLKKFEDYHPGLSNFAYDRLKKERVIETLYTATFNDKEITFLKDNLTDMNDRELVYFLTELGLDLESGYDGVELKHNQDDSYTLYLEPYTGHLPIEVKIKPIT